MEGPMQHIYQLLEVIIHLLLQVYLNSCSLVGPLRFCATFGVVALGKEVRISFGVRCHPSGCWLSY